MSRAFFTRRQTLRTAALPAALLLSLVSPLAAASKAVATQAVAVSNPVHLSVSKAKTPLTDVLTDLARQSKTIILADDTVVSTLDAVTVDKTSVPLALDALVALSPGLTWQRVSLPQDAAVPDAGTLAAQVRALNTITASHLIVTSPASGTAVRFAKTTSQDPTLSSQGLQTVYLVTNETVRSERAGKVAVSAAPAASGAQAPVAQVVKGMQSMADEFTKMTPEQQRQVEPVMFQQFQRIYQSMDPGIRAMLNQQFQNGGPGQ